MDLERLYKDMKEGKVPFLGPDDDFQWSGCNMCGLCCFDTEILLTPYDIVRLRRRLRMTTTDLLKNGLVEVFPGGNSGLPLAMLTFRRVNEKISICPFLGAVVDEGRLRGRMGGKDKPSREDLEAARVPHKYACTVYPARPSVCRSSPLGRMTSWEKEGEEIKRLFYQPPASTCPAIQKEGRVRVSCWIEKNGVQPYWDAGDGFHQLLSTMMEKGLVVNKGADQAAKAAWRIAAGMLYDFDNLVPITEEFPQNRFREGAEEDRLLLAWICQMVEMVAEAAGQIREAAIARTTR